MMRWLAIAVVLAASAARGDCLDELMPRPRTVMRGLDGCLKTPVGPGAYQLVVRGGKPKIQGDEEGRRYAMATFRQLKKLAEAEGAPIPDCAINDWPEFKYRGLMLDCGRNYQSVESIKDVISMLSAYKYNVFHWHLTDNYGWRDELCKLASAKDMPIIHLGTDEARERGEKVPQSHLDYWAKKVTDNGRLLMGWSPGLKLPGQTIKQLWMGANDPRGDKTPYIDSQNSYYINHVDPEELLSVAAYQQPCRWGAKEEKLGAIIGVWHDDAIAETEDVVRMNAVYPAIVLLSDNFWRGREKDEPTLYARLPAPDDPRFGLAVDLERRVLAQRDKVLKGLKHPFPYVAQTHMRWRMTDDQGKTIAEGIPQATIYPRHFWFPAAAYVMSDNGTVTLETWIESPRDLECGAWIGMTGFSRSDGRSRDAPTPKLGEWNKHGATVELNGKRIDPPKWTHPGVGGNPKETPLVDEDYWYRSPAKIRLKAGKNHVKLTLPKRGGWKWIGTFVPVTGTSDHPKEVPGLKFFHFPY